MISSDEQYQREYSIYLAVRDVCEGVETCIHHRPDLTQSQKTDLLAAAARILEMLRDRRAA